MNDVSLSQLLLPESRLESKPVDIKEPEEYLNPNAYLTCVLNQVYTVVFGYQAKDGDETTEFMKAHGKKDKNGVYISPNFTALCELLDKRTGVMVDFFNEKDPKGKLIL